MILRDKLVITENDGITTVATVACRVSYQDELTINQTVPSTTVVNTRITAVIRYRDDVITQQSKVIWRGDTYEITGKLVRMRYAKPHHITLILEKGQG